MTTERKAAEPTGGPARALEDSGLPLRCSVLERESVEERAIVIIDLIIRQLKHALVDDGVEGTAWSKLKAAQGAVAATEASLLGHRSLCL